MNNLSKRFTEVEYILKKLDISNKQKIPKGIWEYIEENKDKKYIVNYDEDKNLEEQNLNIDTIAILTYLNIEYLLDENQRKEMIELLRNDEIIAEQKKSKKYNSKDLFKNSENNNNEVILSESRRERWYDKMFSIFKWFIRNNK